MLRRFRRKENSALQSQPQPLISDDAANTVEPQSLTVLKGATQNIECLTFIPGYDLLLLESSSSQNIVFDIDSVAVRYNSFAGGFLSGKCGAAHLCGDIVASVASVDFATAEIITWRVSSNRILAKLHVPLFRRLPGEKKSAVIPVREFRRTKSLDSTVREDSKFHCLKLTEEQFIVASKTGLCYVIEHSRGTCLTLVHDFKIVDLIDLDVHGNLLFLLSSFSVTVLDNRLRSLLKQITPELTVVPRTISVCASHICIGCDNGKLLTYHITSAFPRDVVLDGQVGKIVSILVLSDDVIACVGSCGRISFVSISSKKVRYILNLSETDGFRRNLYSAIVLGDGSIAVGGDGGFCATFRLPLPLHDVVQECAARIYPCSIVGQRLHPFRSFWLLQQYGISSEEACRKMASLETGPSSLDEWAFGHDLLMKAVNDGAVPACTDFDGKQYHWLRVLYKYCPELAMGEHDLSMVLSMLREAKNAGVINEVETIVHSIETRRYTMDKIVEGQRLMFNAVYELFMHQAEQDVVLQELLQWKRVQQLTGLVNALLACVPFCGALVTNAVAATATVLNDINLHDLVEALLGVGKDTGGGLVTDKMVGLFVERSNVLLSEEEWEKIPERQRKYVEAAATALGMSVEELRCQLLKAASNDVLDDDDDDDDDDDGVPSTDVIVKDLEDLNDGPNKKKNSDSLQTPLTLPIEEAPPETVEISRQVDSKIDSGSTSMTNEGISNEQLFSAIMRLNEEVEKMRKEDARKEERMRRMEENEKTLMTEIGKLKEELSVLKEQRKN